MNAKTTMPKTMIHRAACGSAWDGDGHGNEWRCGAAVYQSTDCEGYSVFEDDGHGNGSHLATLAALDDAKRYADLHCTWLDAGGYGDSPIFAEMARLAQRSPDKPTPGPK